MKVCSSLISIKTITFISCLMITVLLASLFASCTCYPAKYISYTAEDNSIVINGTTKVYVEVYNVTESEMEGYTWAYDTAGAAVTFHHVDMQGRAVEDPTDNLQVDWKDGKWDSVVVTGVETGTAVIAIKNPPRTSPILFAIYPDKKGPPEITITGSLPVPALTMAVNGSGTTTPAVGTHEYSEDEVVNITATAASGWQFDSWTGAVANPSATNTTVTMDADKTVTANFTELPPAIVTLTMAVNGSGSTTPSVGRHEYSEGEVVNITATAASGWQFDSWTGGVANSSSANTTVTMDADKTVTANFTELPPAIVTLTMAVNGSGSTTPSVGGHEYSEGEVVNITATAASGWQFDSWTGAVANPSATNTTVTMDADKTVTANFSPAIPNVSGVWKLEVSNVTSNCGSEGGWISTITIVQEGNMLETTGIKGTTFIVTGSVVGDTVTIGPGAFPDQGGTTTATYIMTIKSDTLMEGSEKWSWTDGVTSCSGGTATIRATRIE